MEQQQCGRSLFLRFGIVTRDDLKPVITEPVVVNGLVMVRFRFEHVKAKNTFKLEPTIHLKKIKSNNSTTVKINYCNFEKKIICQNQWSGTKLEQKERNSHFTNGFLFIVISNFSVKVTVHETIKAKDIPLQKQIFYEDEDLVDFHLCAPDGRVGVQRAFLGLHSEVFMMKLKQEWKETLEGQISLKGVTKQTLQDLKQYIYLGTVPDEALEPLLLIATCYMMDELKDECIAKIVKTVTPEKIDDLVEFACLNNVPDLMRAILFESTGNNIQGLCDLKIRDEARNENTNK